MGEVCAQIVPHREPLGKDRLSTGGSEDKEVGQGARPRNLSVTSLMSCAASGCLLPLSGPQVITWEMKTKDQVTSRALSVLILTSMQMSNRESRSNRKQLRIFRGRTSYVAPIAHPKLGQLFSLGPGPHGAGQGEERPGVQDYAEASSYPLQRVKQPLLKMKSYKLI